MVGQMIASEGARKGWLPPADVYETEDEVVIELDVPGCHFENLSAEVIDGRLIVAGERTPSDGATRRYRMERWTLRPHLHHAAHRRQPRD